MAVNKVEYGNATLIDLTADTVTADTLIEGYTAHDRSGTLITGTATGGGATIKTTTKASSSNATSIAFTGLSAEPLMFWIEATSDIHLTSNSSTRYVVDVLFDGSSVTGHCYAHTANRNSRVYYNTSNYAKTYSNGTLTISSGSSTTGGYFRSGVTYKLAYVY